MINNEHIEKNSEISNNTKSNFEFPHVIVTKAKKPIITLLIQSNIWKQIWEKDFQITTIRQCCFSDLH